MEEIQGLVDISHIQNEAGWSPVIRFIVVPPAKMVKHARQTVSFSTRCNRLSPLLSVITAATRSVVSLARPSDQVRPVLTHLARKIGGDALVVVKIRILGIDEGEPALPG